MPTEKELTAERLGGPLGAVPVYQPATYAGGRTGRGRWFLLRHGADPGVDLGVVWTSDVTGDLGFIPVTDEGRRRTPEMAMSFSAAAAAGTPAGDVFAAWEDRDGLGLHPAGPTTEGDLAILDELFR